jgi:hypothetical protein
VFPVARMLSMAACIVSLLRASAIGTAIEMRNRTSTPEKVVLAEAGECRFCSFPGKTQL